jgi:hypothetical protein
MLSINNFLPAKSHDAPALDPTSFQLYNAIPAQAGIQLMTMTEQNCLSPGYRWIPIFMGMTVVLNWVESNEYGIEAICLKL